MKLTTMTQYSTLVFFVVFAGLCFSVPGQAQDDFPTACIGADRGDLDAALKADPNNIGLRMRIVRKVLEDIPKTDNRRRSRIMLTDLQTQLDEIKKLDPEFTYVYRVLARQHERKQEFEKVLQVLDDYARVNELDYDMRNMRVRALLRLSEQDGKVRPERIDQAADYVSTWFSSGAAPLFAETLASTSTWMVDKNFRKAILKRYAALYQAQPKNVNLIISYACALYVSGKLESAWVLMHEAEEIGLCDDVIGGRHPLIQFLEMKCPEDDDIDRYSGLDLDELRKRSVANKDNLSLTYRLAVRLKAKAYTGERINDNIEEAIRDHEIDYKDAVDSDDRRLAADLQEKLKAHREQKVLITQQIKEAYQESLPLAEAVHKSNSQIDSVTLLLADVNYKLGNVDQSLGFLKESIEQVPFFVPLRDKLAGIYADQKKWDDAARELAGVCRLVSCRASTWEEPAGSALPVPVVGREKLLAEMAANKSAFGPVVRELQKAIQADPRNPNLPSFLSMAYYFGGDKKNASKWMLKAESLGVCGEGGREHDLATYIYDRKSW